MKKETLLERLLEAGYSKQDVYHHESDLYVYVTPVTTQIIKEWCEDNGYSMDWHCPKFTDNITHKPMYDCYWQYYDVNNKEVK